MKHIFYSLSITFILFSVVELIKPGFVVNFFNMNYLLLIIIIFGLISTVDIRKIFQYDKNNMIHGVKIKKLRVHQDVADTNEVIDRPGHLMEVLRDDDDLLSKFGQTTFTVAYPGTIKAFHWHKKQDDLWFFSHGKAVVVLHDLREGSETKGVTQSIVVDASEPQLILIPIGVAHGYKVLGSEPAHLFYHTTESYNIGEPDEERISHDHVDINFDWSVYN